MILEFQGWTRLVIWIGKSWAHSWYVQPGLGEITGIMGVGKRGPGNEWALGPANTERQQRKRSQPRRQEKPAGVGGILLRTQNPEPKARDISLRGFCVEMWMKVTCISYPLMCKKWPPIQQLNTTDIYHCTAVLGQEAERGLAGRLYSGSLTGCSQTVCWGCSHSLAWLFWGKGSISKLIYAAVSLCGSYMWTQFLVSCWAEGLSSLLAASLRLTRPTVPGYMASP